MKKNEWKDKDGKTNANYSFEDGDVVEIMFDTIREGEPRAGVNKTTGEAFIAQDFWLGVKHSELGEVTMKLTPGQAKYLKGSKSYNNLKGKMISVTAKEIETPNGKKQFLAPVVKEA